jgi:hypothetical protein
MVTNEGSTRLPLNVAEGANAILLFYVKSVVVSKALKGHQISERQTARYLLILSFGHNPFANIGAG